MTDTDTTPELKYCPGYDKPADGWTVQSSDDICFRIDPELFAHWSTFFKDIGDLPKPEGEGNVLPFADASAPALQFIVDAVTWLVANAKLHPPLPEAKPMSFKKYTIPPPRFTGDVAAVEEVLYFAGAYDMAILLGPLYESLKRQHFDPSVLFALSATSGFGNLAYWSSKLVDRGLQGMHPRAVHILEEGAPAHLSLLIKLFAEWEKGWAQFAQQLKQVPYDSAKQVFPRRCLAKCPTSLAHKNDYRVFFNRFIPKARRYARENPQFMGGRVFSAWCATQIKCTNCARRIGNDINVAWNRCLTRKSWSLTFTKEELVAAYAALERSPPLNASFALPTIGAMASGAKATATAALSGTPGQGPSQAALGGRRRRTLARSRACNVM